MNTSKKIKVGIVFGGRSAEHEVSVLSAKSILEALDKNRFEPVLIGIDKAGKWRLGSNAVGLLNGQSSLPVNHSRTLPERSGHEHVVKLGSCIASVSVDVVFPALHGTGGEDGTIQGLMRLARVPFVGSCVLASALAMDKDLSKRLLRAAGLPVTEHMALNSSNPIPSFDDVADRLKTPFFVKPANLGSSIGVSKVNNRVDYDQAVTRAFNYDHKILIEAFVAGREFECGVLGNRHAQTSVVGEVIANGNFYCYHSKYVDEQSASFLIPARISEATSRRIQQLALQAFEVLECAGLARVDFFVQQKRGVPTEITINEVNTLPGFTPTSMYPQLWQASGVSNTSLVTRLIDLALEHFDRRESLHTEVCNQ